jgi:hypothetical protein
MLKREDGKSYDITLGYYYDNLIAFLETWNLKKPEFGIEVIPLFLGWNASNIDITEKVPDWLRNRKILETNYRENGIPDNLEITKLYIVVE